MNDNEKMKEDGGSSGSEEEVTDALLASLAVELLRPKRWRKTLKEMSLHS